MSKEFKTGTFKIGSLLKVNRLGFGAMRIIGNGAWGQPKDKNGAIRVLQKALELGINFIDTADSYGPYISEELIGEALYPYPDDLVIATKGGWTRPGPNDWKEDGRPEHLRDALEGSLKRLRLETIDLYQFHTIDPSIPIEESVGALTELQNQGKIRFIGVSNFKIKDLQRAMTVAKVVSVQNRYSLLHREDESVLKFCEQYNIGFIPWYPLEVGRLAMIANPLSSIAQKYNTTPVQIALAWLLKRSKVMLPIPGTSSVAHLEENIKADDISLDDGDIEEIELIAMSF